MNIYFIFSILYFKNKCQICKRMFWIFHKRSTIETRYMQYVQSFYVRIEKDFPFGTNISMTCYINININWKRLTGNYLDLYSLTKTTFVLTLAKWFSITWVINEPWSTDLACSARYLHFPHTDKLYTNANLCNILFLKRKSSKLLS
jgi:hypothetical protein